MKVLTEKDIGAVAVADMNKECIEILTSAMRHIQRRHDISVPSVHLMFISMLIGFIQVIEADATAEFLISMIEKADAGDDAAKLAVIDVDYSKAHTKLLMAFDLFYATPENGGHA